MEVVKTKNRSLAEAKRLGTMIESRVSSLVNSQIFTDSECNPLKRLPSSHRKADNVYMKNDDESEDYLKSGWVLPKEGMRFLGSWPYYYCAATGSYLEMMGLQRFWTYLATFVPVCMAPSLLTFTGFVVNLLACLNLLYHSKDVESKVPSAALLVSAVSLFAYQILDALDGKQANKVQNTPVEEFTDHGCDSVSTSMAVISLAIATQLALEPFTLYLFFLATMVACVLTHFVSHITHCMLFGRIDVTEAQIGIIAVELVTAVCGQNFLRYKMFTLFGCDVLIVHAVIGSAIVSLLGSIYHSVNITLFGGETELEANGIHIPRRALNPTTVAPLYSLATLVALCTACYAIGLMRLHPTLFLVTFGLMFAKMSLTVVMMNVSRCNFDPFDSSLLPALLLTLDVHFLGLFDPETALVCALLYSIMDFVRYFSMSLVDLEQALDVHVCSIKYPVGHPKNRGGNVGFYINGFNNDVIRESWNEFKVNEADGLLKGIFYSN